MIRFEIVCVDDASTDSSLDILEELAKQNQEIRVYKNSQNKGVSYTRNRALSEANGWFIWFVDPDDMISIETVELLLNCMHENKADAVVANYEKIPEDAPLITTAPLMECRVCEPNYYKEGWMYNEDGECRMFSPWRGMFRREFLINKSITFNEGVSWGEDMLFWQEFLCESPKIMKCELVCYFVRQRRGSAMRSGWNRAKDRYISEKVKLSALMGLLNKCGEMRQQLLIRVNETKAQCIFILGKVPEIVFARNEYKKICENAVEYKLIDMIRFYTCYFAYRVKRCLRMFMR